jgi:hypothetical protein
MAETSRRTTKQAAPDVEAEMSTDQVEQRIMLALRWGLPLGTLVAAATVGYRYGAGTAILILAGGVLLGVIAILWASVRTLSGDAPITLEEAIALGAPSAAEEQKRAVLQALKDLEYEKSMGKIAEADYDELLRRYRTEAKRLLRAVDEDLAPARARAAAFVAEHLGQDSKSLAPAAKGPDLRAAPAPAKGPDLRACPNCQVENDGDALFCKKCGSKLTPESRDEQDATA